MKRLCLFLLFLTILPVSAQTTHSVIIIYSDREGDGIRTQQFLFLVRVTDDSRRMDDTAFWFATSSFFFRYLQIYGSNRIHRERGIKNQPSYSSPTKFTSFRFETNCKICGAKRYRFDVTVMIYVSLVRTLSNE